MADTAVETPTTSPPKKGKGGKKAGPKGKSSKPTHPPTAQMVKAAITNLKERGGSSLQAIKKYISSTYKVDAEKLSPFIRKYIKSSVSSGSLVQTKGKGASGSFKLPGAGGEGAAKTTKKPAAKKAVVKKPAAKKAAPAPPKAKTTKKPPTTPKAPKPKKAKATPKAAAKKPAKAKKAAKKTSPKKK